MSVCAIVISDTMIACRATFLLNNSMICDHNSRTMTASIHDYWPPSGYSIQGTEKSNLYVILANYFLVFLKVFYKIHFTYRHI